MIEKVIATRKEFLEWNSILKKANPSSSTSVEYREAVYIFREKVEKHVVAPAREIFKLPEEIEAALKSRSKELYDAGLPFALNIPEISGQDYTIDPKKVEEWSKVAESIDTKYIDAIQASDKNDLELAHWCSKKIQISFEKIELSQMPSFDSNTFYKVAKILCTEVPTDEEDGKEVE